MFLARVLAGEWSIGHQGAKQPSTRADHYPLEACVDQLQNPSIIVLFQDDQAFHEYIITFQQQRGYDARTDSSLGLDGTTPTGYMVTTSTIVPRSLPRPLMNPAAVNYDNDENYEDDYGDG